MKMSYILIGAVLLVTGYLGWLAIQQTIIKPKNTRLAFYEIMTASKDNKHNTAEQMSSWLDGLMGLETKHLKHCEQIQYHNKNANLKRRLKALDKPPGLKMSSLQKVAQRYYTDPPTHEFLARLGETEFESVMSEISLFENELKNTGFTGTLNELATQPTNFSVDPKEVEQIYNRLILEGELTLQSRFYPYDVPKGTAHVSEQSHRWSTYAQYNSRENSMTAFFDEGRYDTKVAAFISIHEMFPGHHLERKAAISNPLCPGDDPSSFTWLGEGWATYVEYIANEEGFFDKPEYKLAWLDYRLTRTMRIILDVKRMEGITEYEALNQIWEQRMPERLAGRFDHEFKRLKKSRHQHLSYIFGYKAISETKTKLIEELGPGFDEKKFHDAVLRLEHQEAAAFFETVKIAMDIPRKKQNALEGEAKN